MKPTQLHSLFSAVVPFMKDIENKEGIWDCIEFPEPIGVSVLCIVLLLEEVRLLHAFSLSYDVLVVSNTVNVVIESHRFIFYEDHILHIDVNNMMEPISTLVKHEEIRQKMMELFHLPNQ